MRHESKLCIAVFVPGLWTTPDFRCHPLTWKQHTHLSTLHRLICWSQTTTAANRTATTTTLATTAMWPTGASTRSSPIPVGDLRPSASLMEDEATKAPKECFFLWDWGWNLCSKCIIVYKYSWVSKGFYFFSDDFRAQELSFISGISVSSNADYTWNRL